MSMQRFNKKIAPLFIAGTAIFVLGTAFKYVFLTDHAKTKKSAPKAKERLALATAQNQANPASGLTPNADSAP